MHRVESRLEECISRRVTGKVALEVTAAGNYHMCLTDNQRTQEHRLCPDPESDENGRAEGAGVSIKLTQVFRWIQNSPERRPYAII